MTERSAFDPARIRWPLASVLVPFGAALLSFSMLSVPRLRDLHGDAAALLPVALFALYAVLTPYAYRRNKRLREDALGDSRK